MFLTAADPDTENDPANISEAARLIAIEKLQGGLVVNGNRYRRVLRQRRILRVLDFIGRCLIILLVFASIGLLNGLITPHHPRRRIAPPETNETTPKTMLNRIILIGRLARDPEATKTPNDISVTKFSIAVDRPQSAEARQCGAPAVTDWIDIVTWRQTADFAAKYLQKGRLVAVEGKLQIRNWQNEAGEKRKAAEVVADNVKPLGRNPDSEAGGTGEGGGGGYQRQGQAQSRPAPNRNTAPASDDYDDMTDPF